MVQMEKEIGYTIREKNEVEISKWNLPTANGSLPPPIQSCLSTILAPALHIVLVSMLASGPFI